MAATEEINLEELDRFAAELREVIPIPFVLDRSCSPNC